MRHTVLHQLLVSDLVGLVADAEEPWQECLTHFGARLADDTYLCPDLIVARREQLRDDLWYVQGAPLLAIEVASKASRAGDLGAKKDMWQRFGVPAYWVVDAVDGALHVHVFELADASYVNAARLGWGDTYQVKMPFEGELSTDAVFDRLVRRRRPKGGDVSDKMSGGQRHGDDLPAPTEPFDIDSFGYRWPTGAEKAELWDGCPVFYGDWDERDVEIAERAYPGRVIELEQPPGVPGTMVVRPGGADEV